MTDLTAEELLRAIIDNDWKTLIDFLPGETEKEKGVYTDLVEYKLHMNYPEDARYTYPRRKHLINEVLKRLIEQQKPGEGVEDD